MSLLQRRWSRPFSGGAPWPQSWTLPSWQAHRGYHLAGEKENTLGALQAAAAHGALMCEFDVRLSLDQVPVLYHDAEIPLNNGNLKMVSEMNLAELKEVAGVSTLEEVFKSSRVPSFLNVEIKSESIWNETLERRIVEVAKRNPGIEKRILFSSFNPISLWKMSNLLPQVPRALLVAMDLENRWLREMALLPLLRVHALHLDEKLLARQEDVRFWQKKGFRIGVWTVNDPAAIERYWSWGVDSVITDLIPD